VINAQTWFSTMVWHACAVQPDGTARCWGRNHAGQLGNGTTDDAVLQAVTPLVP